jgi:hypothetical protein
MAGEAYSSIWKGWVEGALMSSQVVLQEGWGIKMSPYTKDILYRAERNFAKWKDL